VWCGVVLLLTTLSQLLEMILELDCVLECHTGLCEIFSDHYLLSVKKARKYLISKKIVHIGHNFASDESSRIGYDRTTLRARPVSTRNPGVPPHPPLVLSWVEVDDTS
jgi:hypothetical protein